LGCKERTCQANWPWNYFGRIPTYVITIHQRHRQTDGQTTYDRNTALCTKVHRAVIKRGQDMKVETDAVFCKYPRKCMESWKSNYGHAVVCRHHETIDMCDNWNQRLFVENLPLEGAIVFQGGRFDLFLGNFFLISLYHFVWNTVSKYIKKIKQAALFYIFQFSEYLHLLTPPISAWPQYIGLMSLFQC